ncbi:MAG TPA: PilZ domain-containing protein [Kofleriaceae bacterium]|jgi:hypothetical protein|nr:PilZ domain-containing protein [Kofleriaceae bacterium]
MTENRRAHRRYALRLAAEIRAGARSFTATTRDLSEGGCCIEGAYPLEDGALIDVALFLVIDGVEDAHQPPLEVRARVQWAAGNPDAPADVRNLAGLHFEGMTPAQTQWLSGVLARCSPGE